MVLQDIITIVSLIFGVFGGIFGYIKWKPQKRSIEVDIIGKVISNLEKMTDLYDEADACCRKLKKENENLHRKLKVT